MQVQINKINSLVNVETERFNHEVQTYIFNYGLKQILNDCHSQVNKNTVDSTEDLIAGVNEAINNKLAALYAGKVSIRGEGKGTSASRKWMLVGLAQFAIANGSKASEEALIANFKHVKELTDIIAKMSDKYGMENGDIFQQVSNLALAAKASQPKADESDLEDIL